ncbi:hypothetical protein AHAS_Ahas13G0424200 [Arachis hypogaea]
MNSTTAEDIPSNYALTGEMELELGLKFLNKEAVMLAVKNYNICRSAKFKVVELDHTRPHDFAFDDRDDNRSPHIHSSKCVMLERDIHTLIKHTSFSSPTDVGPYNPPPNGAQRPRWHIDPGSGFNTICNSLDHPLARYCPLWHTKSHGFAFDDRDDSRNPPHSLVKTRHVRERYPHPYKACFVPLPNRCGTLHLTRRWEHNVYCVRHIASNSAANFKSKEAKRHLVNAAYSKTQEQAQHYLELISVEDPATSPAMMAWIRGLEPPKWLQHRDEGRRYSHMTMNLSECINSMLKGTRNLPVCAIIKSTYHRLNALFVNKGQQAEAQVACGQIFSQFLQKAILANREGITQMLVTSYDRATSIFTVDEITVVGAQSRFRVFL